MKAVFAQAHVSQNLISPYDLKSTSMKNKVILLLVFVLLSDLVLFSQSVQDLESELKDNPISNILLTRRVAKELLKIDRYNETGIHCLVATFYPIKDSISIFFDNLIKSDPENPIPYILRAKYEYYNQHEYDSSNVTFLKKAYQLDKNNIEANFLLGITYYYMFIDNKNDGNKKYYAINSRHYLTNLNELDKCFINETRYPLTQISKYLNDSIIISNQDYTACPGEYYYPLELLVNLPFGWETNFEFNVIEAFDIGKIYDRAYSKNLKALQEPRLFDQSNGKKIYRFTWLRSFHNPIVIGLENNNDSIALYWKVCDGTGGHEPGNLFIDKSKELSVTVWNEFNTLIEKSSLWNIKNTDNGDIGIDGACWILERKNGNTYNVVDIWSPKENDDFKKYCMYLLNLTDLEIPKSEIY